jgi:hypothetical protein
VRVCVWVGGCVAVGVCVGGCVGACVWVCGWVCVGGCVGGCVCQAEKGSDLLSVALTTMPNNNTM